MHLSKFLNSYLCIDYCNWFPGDLILDFISDADKYQWTNMFDNEIQMNTHNTVRKYKQMYKQIKQMVFDIVHSSNFVAAMASCDINIESYRLLK